jgi:ParB-like chromosome segregation protein Spo0J
MDPVDKVEWVEAKTLQGNNWNPNVVFNQELRLLERSILRTGWVQPILVSVAGTIIDGFHRWRLALESQPLLEKYAGKVPVCRLDVSEDVAMLLTVRMNRAKGTHVAVRMSGLVRQLVDDHGYTLEEIAREIGGTVDEAKLLYEDSIFKARNLSAYRYSKAWVPAEGRITKTAEARL